MLSSAIISATVLADAAVAIKLFSTADIGANTETNADTSLAAHGSSALAQIESAAQTLEHEDSALLGGLDKAGDENLNRFRNDYEEREEGLNNGTIDLMALPDDYSASGSYSVADEGFYSNEDGSGDWEYNASQSFSLSFNNNFRPHTPEEPTPSPSPVEPTPSPSRSPVSPSPVSPETPSLSPEPIAVNPCDCCDCGDGTFKVPVAFGSAIKEVPIPENGKVTKTHPNGTPAEVCTTTTTYFDTYATNSVECMNYDEFGNELTGHGKASKMFLKEFTLSNEHYIEEEHADGQPARACLLEGMDVVCYNVNEAGYITTTDKIPYIEYVDVRDVDTVEGFVLEKFEDGVIKKVRSRDGVIYTFNKHGLFAQIKHQTSPIYNYNYFNGLLNEPVAAPLHSNVKTTDVWSNGAIKATRSSNVQDLREYAPDGTLTRRNMHHWVVYDELVPVETYANGEPAVLKLSESGTEFYFDE